jgi:hypothetical protein
MTRRHVKIEVAIGTHQTAIDGCQRAQPGWSCDFMSDALGRIPLVDFRVKQFLNLYF